MVFFISDQFAGILTLLVSIWATGATAVKNRYALLFLVSFSMIKCPQPQADVQDEEKVNYHDGAPSDLVGERHSYFD
jgi:hypothetical protein